MVFFPLITEGEEIEKKVMIIKKKSLITNFLEKMTENFSENRDFVYYFIVRFFEEEKKTNFKRILFTRDFQLFCNYIFYWCLQIHNFVTCHGLGNIIS